MSPAVVAVRDSEIEAEMRVESFGMPAGSLPAASRKSRFSLPSAPSRRNSLEKIEFVGRLNGPLRCPSPAVYR